MAHLYVAQSRVVDEGVIHRQCPDPGDAEEELDALGEQSLDEELGAGDSHQQVPAFPVVEATQVSGYVIRSITIIISSDTAALEPSTSTGRAVQHSPSDDVQPTGLESSVSRPKITQPAGPACTV